MFKKTLLAAIVSNIFVISIAHADIGYLNDGHPFLIAGFGYGYLATQPTQNSTQVGATSYQASVSGLAWNMGGGYLWYKDHFAYGAKLAYSHYPGSRYTILQPNLPANTISYQDNSNIDLFAVGEYFFLPRFNVMLLAGGSDVFQPVKVNNSSYQAQKILPSFGLGFAYRITTHISIEADTQCTMGSTPDVSQSSWSPYSVAAERSTNIGMIYTF